MPQTLRYSDIKGRTDLVGRKIYFYSGLNHAWVLDYLSEKFAHFTRADGKDVWGRKFYEGKDDDEIELLDEEPEGAQFYGKSAAIYQTQELMEQNKKRNAELDEKYKDTSTEITWENATMDDLIVSPNGGIVDSLRNWARLKAKSEGWYLKGSKDEPVKMTISQIEEKIGHKVEIVE